jgi:hypothetical protein
VRRADPSLDATSVARARFSVVVSSSSSSSLPSPSFCFHLARREWDVAPPARPAATHQKKTVGARRAATPRRRVATASRRDDETRVADRRTRAAPNRPFPFFVSLAPPRSTHARGAEPNRPFPLYLSLSLALRAGRYWANLNLFAWDFLPSSEGHGVVILANGDGSDNLQVVGEPSSRVARRIF